MPRRELGKSYSTLTICRARCGAEGVDVHQARAVDEMGGVVDVVPEAKPPHEPALAAFLRYRLEMLGISVEELIRRSGVSRSTVYRLLGDRPPSIVSTEILHKLADALGVDAGQLAGLWHGTVTAVESGEGDEREALVRGFVLATADLTYEELQAALEVAKAAAAIAKRPSTE